MLGLGEGAGLQQMGRWWAEATWTTGALPTIAPVFPFWQHLLKVMAVLSGMLGSLLLVLYLWKRVGSGRRGATPFIRVLATHYLAPKKALIMVAVGKERFLLASSAEQLTLVTPLAPDETDNVSPPGEPAPGTSPGPAPLTGERERSP